MGKRWLMAMVAVVAVVAVGGIGFAAFTANAYIGASAQAGTLSLYWGAPGGTMPTGTGSQSYNTCPAGLLSEKNTNNDTVTFSAGNLAPGDYCTFSATLYDGGSLPGTVTAIAVGPSVSTICTLSDGYGTAISHPAVSWGSISPTTPISYTASIGLEAGLGNSYQGSSCSFTITVTATAS